MKQILLKAKEFFLELRKNWLIIVLIVIPFVGLTLWNTLKTPAEFRATLSFMVNEDEGGSSGAMSLLNQFGLGGSGAEYNYPKILKLAQSRSIIQEVLFDNVEIEGETDFIANHIIKLYNYHEKWDKSTPPTLRNFLFTSGEYLKFSTQENHALQLIHKKVVGDKNMKNPLINTSYDEETSILSISAQSLVEPLSYAICTKVYDVLSTFYIEKSTERQNLTVHTLKEKKDSVKAVLGAKEYEFARLKDVNRNVYLHTEGSLKEMRLQRDIQVLNVMYGELVKNLEASDFALKNATPFFAIIEDPILPLTIIKESLLKKLILSMIIGGFLASAFIIGRKIIRDVLRDN